jgi:uncharacterized protein YqgQ
VTEGAKLLGADEATAKRLGDNTDLSLSLGSAGVGVYQVLTRPVVTQLEPIIVRPQARQATAAENNASSITNSAAKEARGAESVSKLQAGDVGPANSVSMRVRVNASDTKWSHLTFSERHFPGRASIPKKSGNTMLTVTPKEASVDLAEIRKLGDGIRTGETFTVTSGRVYGVHNNSIHPVSGPGVVDITSSEYNILVTARKKGLEKAQMSLDKMTERGIFSQEQYARTKALLEIINEKGD